MKQLVGQIFSNKIIKFILVGGCSTGIDFIIYMLVSLRWPITLSKGVSMIVSSIFSYVANKHYTFGNKEKTSISYLIRFYAIFIANFCTNLGVNYLIYQETGKKIVAYIIATICGMTVNYMGQRFFVFNQKE